MTRRPSEALGFFLIVLVPPILVLGAAVAVASQILTPAHVGSVILGFMAGSISVTWVAIMSHRLSND